MEIESASNAGVLLGIEDTAADRKSLSRRLFNALPQIQWMLSLWFPGEFRRVEVSAPLGESNSAPEGRATAVFFSAGVDSFYTLPRNLRQPGPDDPAITHLGERHLFWRGVKRWAASMFTKPDYRTLRDDHRFF